MKIRVLPTFRGPLNVVFPDGECWFFDPLVVTARNGRQKRIKHTLSGKIVNGKEYRYDPEYKAFFRDGNKLPETLP